MSFSHGEYSPPTPGELEMVESMDDYLAKVAQQHAPGNVAAPARPLPQGSEAAAFQHAVFQAAAVQRGLDTALMPPPSKVPRSGVAMQAPWHHPPAHLHVASPREACPSSNGLQADFPATQLYSDRQTYGLQDALKEMEDEPCSQDAMQYWNNVEGSSESRSSARSSSAARLDQGSEGLGPHQQMLPAALPGCAARVTGQPHTSIREPHREHVQQAVSTEGVSPESMPADIAASHALSNAEDVEASLSHRIGADVLLQVRTELSPTHRTAILLAVMHVPAMWHNTTMHVQHWLEVYRRARAPKPKAPPQVNTIVMTVFSGCTGSGTPIIALMWALQNCMKQWPTWAIVIDRFLSYEISQNCNASAELCYSMLPCPVEQRGNLEQMEADVVLMLSADPEKARQRCYFCMAGTECSDTTFANGKSLLSGSRLHGDHGRTWFYWHAAVTRLARAVGSNRVVHVSEYPQCQDKADEEAINRMAGTHVETHTSSWGAYAVRHRRWRTSPRIGHTKMNIRARFCAGRADIAGPDKDGWQYCPEPAYHAQNQQPYVLRRFWPYLVENQFKKTRKQPLSAMEQATLSSLRISKGGVIRRAGVQFYIRHLGLEETPLQRITELWPCEVWPLGAPADPARPTPAEDAERCGEKQFCINCFEALRMLGGAWHLHSAAEVCSHALITAMGYWGQNQPADWHGWGADPHACSASCPHVAVYATEA